MLLLYFCTLWVARIVGNQKLTDFPAFFAIGVDGAAGGNSEDVVSRIDMLKEAVVWVSIRWVRIGKHQSGILFPVQPAEKLGRADLLIIRKTIAGVGGKTGRPAEWTVGRIKIDKRAFVGLGPALRVESACRISAFCRAREAASRFAASQITAVLYFPNGTLKAPFELRRKRPLKHVLFRKISCAARRIPSAECCAALI